MQPTFNDFQETIKLDNSDTFWLIFADYCDENEIVHDIREQIRESYSQIWCFEWGTNNSVGCNGLHPVVDGVGGYTGFSGGDGVGSYTGFSGVGGNGGSVIGVGGSIIGGSVIGVGGGSVIRGSWVGG